MVLSVSLLLSIMRWFVKIWFYHLKLWCIKIKLMILFYVYQTKGWQNKCLRNWWQTSLLTIRVNPLFSVELQKCFSLKYRNLSLFIMHYFQCNKFTFAIFLPVLEIQILTLPSLEWMLLTTLVQQVNIVVIGLGSII